MRGVSDQVGYPQALALLRVGFGAYFLSEGFDKLMKGWLSSPDQLLTRLTGPQGSVTRGTVQSFYQPFLEHVVAPNAGLFAQLIVVGECTVGILLILGLFTRLAAIGGAWLNLNYMLMKGLANNAGNSDRLFLLGEIVFFVTAAGLVWGLDGLLRDALARNPATRWLVTVRHAGHLGTEVAEAKRRRRAA